MSTFEVIRGVEGCCLALDDTRIAGPKPWGGGTVIHAWETDKEYKAVDTHSRWHELFGTPERAARTISVTAKCFEPATACRDCIYKDYCDTECDYGKLLEWLKTGGGRMTVYIGEIETFPHVKPDKAQVVKIGEECMEVFSAWEDWESTHDCELLPHLVDECADTIQAICNLLAARGVENMRPAMVECEWRNRERGRYGE